jgi:uncharacterized protein
MPVAEQSSSPPARAAGSPEPASGSRRWRLLGLLALVLLTFDLMRPPAAQLSTRLLLAGIAGYQATLSPRLPALGVSCRFTPTCSHYGRAVIAREGALIGGARTAARIARCGPWTPAGTVDPP